MEDCFEFFSTPLKWDIFKGVVQENTSFYGINMNYSLSYKENSMGITNICYFYSFLALFNVFLTHFNSF